MGMNIFARFCDYFTGTEEIKECLKTTVSVAQHWKERKPNSEGFSLRGQQQHLFKQSSLGRLRFAT